MTKKFKILFMCKHNVFRSKVAESYFNKINKNKNIIASSSGLFVGLGLSNYQKKIVKIQKNSAKNLGINLIYNPRPTTIGLLRSQDLIIIVADNIPKSFFNTTYIKKAIKWDIPDYKESDPKTSIETSIKMIIKRVDSLVNELKKKQ